MSVSHTVSPSSSEISSIEKSQNIDKDIVEQKSQWLPKILEDDPVLLALRERTLPWTGGISFANMVHTASTASPVVFNRHSILEFVYNHLLSIGMDKTAELLVKETGHRFQILDEPWDRTSLVILVSLGVLPREDPWNIISPPNVKFLEEPLEEDFFASQYRENPNDIFLELIDSSSSLVFDGNGKSFRHIKVASFRRLIVSLVSSQFDLKEEDLNEFFLTLHTMTTSEHFLLHLRTLYQEDFSDESKISEVRSLYPNLKVIVISILRKWLAFHGLFIGRKTLSLIEQFCRMIGEKKDIDTETEYTIRSIMVLLPTLKYGQALSFTEPNEEPIIKDPQIIFCPTLSLLDPDPMEVARQITLLAHSSFSAIHSREFIHALSDLKSSIQTPTLKEFLDFDSNLEKVTLEAILKSQDKISAIKRIAEIASALDSLSNFDSLSVVLNVMMRDELRGLINAAFQDDSISRLCSRCGTQTDTVDWYKRTLFSRFLAWKPTIPNILTELKMGPATHEPDFINGMINWKKRHHLAERPMILYRFQNRPYNFWKVPQIQKIIIKGPQMTAKVYQHKLVEIYKTYQ